MAWFNPRLYMLDLAGLASLDALRAPRRTESAWITRLTDRYGVRYAMIYAAWYPKKPCGLGRGRHADAGRRADHGLGVDGDVLRRRDGQRRGIMRERLRRLRADPPGAGAPGPRAARGRRGRRGGLCRVSRALIPIGQQFAARVGVDDLDVESHAGEDEGDGVLVEGLAGAGAAITRAPLPASS